MVMSNSEFMKMGTGDNDFNALALEAKARQMLADQLQVRAEAPPPFGLLPVKREGMPPVWTSGNTQFTPGLNYTFKPRMLDEADYLREELDNHKIETERYRKLAMDYKNQRDEAQAYHLDRYGREARLVLDCAKATAEAEALKVQLKEVQTNLARAFKEQDELRLKLAERVEELAQARSELADLQPMKPFKHAMEELNKPDVPAKSRQLNRAISNMGFADTRMGLPLHDRH